MFTFVIWAVGLWIIWRVIVIAWAVVTSTWEVWQEDRNRR